VTARPLTGTQSRGETPEPERPRAGPAPLPQHAAILALQQSAGNAAVARALMQRQDAPAAPAATRPDLARPSKGPDVELLQLKLNWHLGFMRRTLLDVDSDFGGKTERAVVAVKRARGVRPFNGTVDAAMWAELDQQPSAGPASAQAGRGPEYDRMLEDGLLDVTLAIGFDEHGVLPGEAHEIRRGLAEVRAFAQDDARASEMRTAAGRPDTPGGTNFVKENYGTSAGQPVHAALKLIEAVTETATGDSGADARTAALAGMNASDLFAYGGHARYGTGPDFDRNYHFVVHWDVFPNAPADRSGDETIGTIEEFSEATHITTRARFEQLESAGAVEFVPDPGGNIVINTSAQSHVRDFGAYLMTRANAGQGDDALATSVTESRYRLWMFNGCSTRDYVGSVRRNPLLGTRELDMVVTDPTTYLTSYAEGILSFLDGVMAQESARALDERMEDATPFESATHSSSGFEDNPRR
jgi:peptidoglycan hydrolase-like protein with peptidoglycan-binding domain